MAEASRGALLQHIAELELRLQQRDEELAAERDRSSRARKKARQLLAKLGERDEAIAELKEALDKVRAAASAPTPAAASKSGSSAAARSLGAKFSRQPSVASAPDEGRRSQRQPSAVSTAVNSPRGSAAGRDRAARRRTEIVVQLEGHLVQMRSNLAESEREVRELEDRRLAKEAEWGRLPEAARSVESAEAHHAALAMILRQVQEKRSFARELTRKTQELEEQVARQRSLLEEPCHRTGGSSDSEVAGAAHEEEEEEEAEPSEPPRPGRDGGDAGQAAEGAAACQDEALGAFLLAAGATAEVVLDRPALRAAFEARPPKLSGCTIEGCSAEQRSHALSLFTAWVAVAGASPPAMHMCDLNLKSADAEEVRSTLEACGAQLELWEMTRCPASDATVRLLLGGLATQPLAHLNLSYNTLGPSGACALAGVMSSWAPRLQSLVLEMNGLGDRGCKEVAGVLAGGLLPGLRVLELGWNELSSACAPAIAGLLVPGTRADAGGQPGGGRAPCAVPRLQKLGLGGNGLGSDGGHAVILAALSQPSRALELDLSMNHIGSPPLRAMSEWAEARVSFDLRISVNLEWNVVDDSRVVSRLARAMAGKAAGGAASGGNGAGGGARRVIVRLANNELIDLDPEQVAAESGGLVLL